MSLVPGTYKGKVSKLFYSESKQKRTPCMVAAIDLGANTTRSVSFWLTDACWEFSEPKLRKIGWNGETEEGKVAWDSNAEFEWDMTMEPRQDKPGTMQERWDLGGRGPRPVAAPPDKAALFKARYSQNGPAPAPQPHPALTPTPPTTSGAASPPVPPTPIKRPVAPPPSDGVVKDKASAWNHINATFNSDNPESLSAKWFEAIGKVEKDSGKDEAAFGPEGWNAVVSSYVPF